MKRYATAIATAVLAFAGVANAKPVSVVEYRGPGYTVSLSTEEGWATVNGGAPVRAVRLEWSAFSFGRMEPTTVAFIGRSTPLVIDPNGSADTVCAVLVVGSSNRPESPVIRARRVSDTPFPVLEVEDAWMVVRVPPTGPASGTACRIGNGEEGAEQIVREHNFEIETPDGYPVRVTVATGAVTWEFGRTTAVDIQTLATTDVDITVTAGDRTVRTELRGGTEQRSGRCILIGRTGTGTAAIATGLGQIGVAASGSEESRFPFVWYDVTDNVDTEWTILFWLEGAAPCSLVETE